MGKFKSILISTLDKDPLSLYNYLNTKMKVKNYESQEIKEEKSNRKRTLGKSFVQAKDRSK